MSTEENAELLGLMQVALAKVKEFVVLNSFNLTEINGANGRA